MVQTVTVPGLGEIPLTALTDGLLLGTIPAGCAVGDGAGCLVSLGTFQLQPRGGAPAR